MIRKVIDNLCYSELPYKNLVQFLKMNPRKIQKFFELFLRSLKDGMQKRYYKLQASKMSLGAISFTKRTGI